MHVEIVLVDTSLLRNVGEIFLLFIKFKFLWKNGVSEEIKAHLPQKPPALQQLFSPHFFNFFLKKMLAPPTFKEGRHYAFYMIDYEGETIKLLHLFL